MSYFSYRYAALDKHKESALGVIYVVDASTIKHQIRDSAEFLFKILSDPVSLTSTRLYHSAYCALFRVSSR